jgi:hypothetical protein
LKVLKTLAFHFPAKCEEHEYLYVNYGRGGFVVAIINLNGNTVAW